MLEYFKKQEMFFVILSTPGIDTDFWRYSL